MSWEDCMSGRPHVQLITGHFDLKDDRQYNYLAGKPHSGPPSPSQSPRPEAQAGPFKANSVWQGTCEQSNPKSIYPMILFVRRRDGDSFEGVTWYPTLDNGLIKVTGRIDRKGTVTFTEGEVIHGEVTAN